MGGKLKENFKPAVHWPNFKSSEVVGFDNFYDHLAKWAVDQKTLSYEDFSPDEIAAPK